MNEERRHRWEDAASWPLIAASAVFLGAFAWPILDPGLPRGWRAACATVVGSIWLVYLVDYAVRLALAGQRVRFVRRHVLDLASVFVPVLRPLLAFRVIDRKLGETLRGRVTYYLPAITVLVLMMAALSILDAERGAEGANISSPSAALWWSMVTMTTVGYGDFYPVTTTGRLLASGLMLFGVGLLGAVTATMASHLVNRFDTDEGDPVEELLGEVRALRAEVRDLRGTSVREDPPK